MPWCDDCSKFWAPTAMEHDGSCPTCGRVLEAVERPGRATLTPDGAPVPTAGPDDDDGRAPWHFYVLVVAVVAYLGWRLIELIGWLIT